MKSFYKNTFIKPTRIFKENIEDFFEKLTKIVKIIVKWRVFLNF